MVVCVLQTAEVEFLPPAHPDVAVTGSTLGAHRAARLQAERQRNGQPRKVQYEGIPATDLTTADVVQLLVLPVAHQTHESYAAAMVPARHVGSPTHFASHAWGRPYWLACSRALHAPA